MSDNNNNAVHQEAADLEKITSVNVFDVSSFPLFTEDADQTTDLVDLATSKAVEMGATGGEQTPTHIAVLGTQSSGKSSVVNLVIANMSGDDEKLAPTAAEVCSKRPLEIYLGEGEASKYTLTCDGTTRSYDTAQKVFNYINTVSEGDKVGVVFDPATAFKLKINSKKSGRIMDTPGKRASFDASGKKEDYFSCVARLHESPNPILVPIVKASSENDIEASPIIVAISDDYVANPGKWSSAEIVVVLNCADLYVDDHSATESIIKSVVTLKEKFQKFSMKISFYLVQADIGDKKDHSLSEIREAERKTLARATRFRNATFDGSPLFGFGSEELARYLVSKLKSGIVNSEKTLTALSNYCASKIQEIEDFNKILRAGTSPSASSREIVRRLTKESEKADSRMRVAGRLHVLLREHVENWYSLKPQRAENIEMIDPDFGKEDYAFASVMNEEITNGLYDCINYLATHSDPFTDLLVRDFTSRVEEKFRCYKSFTVLTQILEKSWTCFITKHIQDTFADHVSTRIKEQQAMIVVLGEKDDNKVFQAWPANSKIVRDAKKFKFQNALIRRIVGLLKYIKNILLVAYGNELEKKFAEYFDVALDGQRDVVEKSQTDHTQLSIKKREYKRVRHYCESILGNIKKPSVSTKRPLEENTGIFQSVVDGMTGVVDTMSGFVGIKKQKK